MIGKDSEDKIINDPHFYDFLNREFEKTVVHATIEELAEFAFGSLKEAIDCYKEETKLNKK